MDGFGKTGDKELTSIVTIFSSSHAPSLQLHQGTCGICDSQARLIRDLVHRNTGSWDIQPT